MELDWRSTAILHSRPPDARRRQAAVAKRHRSRPQAPPPASRRCYRRRSCALARHARRHRGEPGATSALFAIPLERLLLSREVAPPRCPTFPQGPSHPSRPEAPPRPVKSAPRRQRRPNRRGRQLPRPLLVDCHPGLPSSRPRGGPPTVSALARARPWRPRGRPWPCSQPGRAAAERGQGRSSTTSTIPQELCGVSRTPFTPWSAGATGRAPRPQTKGAPPATASPSPAARGRTSPPFEEEPVNLHEAQDKPCNPTGRPIVDDRPSLLQPHGSLPHPRSVAWVRPGLGREPRARSLLSGQKVPLSRSQRTHAAVKEWVGSTPRRQHATSAFHVPASDTFVRSISLRFDAFAKQCKRLPSFGALDFLPAEGILHSSATSDAAHVPWERGTSPAEGPGRGPCPLAGPAYPRTSKEMSPCSNVSTLSTIRRSVSIFSDVEHPGLYQMPPPISKP